MEKLPLIHMYKKLFTLCFLVLGLVSTAQDKTKELDSLMDRYKALGWNVVVMAGTAKGPLYQKAIGWENIEEKKPMRLNTLFKTESVGKMFTAVRLLQLLERGKVRLQDSVNAYLPELNIPNGNNITLHHLLMHTSGLGSHWDTPDFDFSKRYTLPEIVASTPLIFNTPGERRYYSNTGYFLLARIIEKHDGLPFYQSIEKNIFKPAGMKFTTVIKENRLPNGTAQPYYQVSATEFAPDTTKYTASTDMGAGGWISTAGDLYRFLQAYLSGKFLKPETMQLQQTANGSVADTTAGFRYGVALLETSFKQPALYGHNGGGRGFSVDMFFEPVSGQIVVMCANMYGVGYGLSTQFFARLLDKKIPPPLGTSPVRFVNALREKGTAAFENDPDNFFKSIGLAKSERTLQAVVENLSRIGDYKTAAAVLSTARNAFPGSTYLLYQSGLVARALHNKEEAIAFFKDARREAELKKDTYLVQMSDKHLKELE